VLIFVFLQYNRVFIATVNAYVSPGTISPQNIVINPTGDVIVSADPRLIIPKINVDVPVVYDVGNDYDSQMAAMSNGIAHFAIPGASSHPGQTGNTVLSGHSSNDLFDGGDYKFIFAQLEKMTVGDTVYANYQGKRYTYVVTKTEIVKPTEVSKLVYATTKPVLTLITCTPLGTSRDRLLVSAEQVSPDPAAAATAPVDDSTITDASIPGNSPTFIERLFGAR
jgi:sortase A